MLDRLLRFTRIPDDGSANLWTLVTFQRKTYFTFHRRPKRRRRTVTFRAKLTCKCPLIVCAMMYNYFLKLYFFYQATLDEICIFLFFQKVFTFQWEGLYASRHISTPFVFFCFAYIFCSSLISFCNFFTFLLVLFFNFFILLKIF